MTTPATVIGASIAGLFAGYHLARGGVPTTIYEARPSLDLAPRTLIVTPAWLRLLDFNAEQAVLNRIHTFELISRSESARITLDEPDSILERRRFVELLSQQVRRAGGNIVANHRLEHVAQLGGSYELHLHNGAGTLHTSAAHLIGADGIHSVVARAVSDRHPRSVALLQARVPMPADLDPHTVRVWFDRGSTRFFFWLIPESNRTAVAGLIADTAAQARDALGRFLSAHDLEPRAYQAAPVPMAPLRLRRDVPGTDGRLALIGDAAAQVKTTTVGGVVTGMRGAQAAARAILDDTSYSRELQSLRRELNAHTLLRVTLDGFTDEDYDTLLRLLNRGAARVLSAHPRDQLAHGLWWRLVRAQPRWLTLAVRALIRRAGQAQRH
jgi:flavin-dependent dehydrogenase